jgi:hypothetical protein
MRERRKMERMGRMRKTREIRGTREIEEMGKIGKSNLFPHPIPHTLPPLLNTQHPSPVDNPGIGLKRRRITAFRCLDLRYI